MTALTLKRPQSMQRPQFDRRCNADANQDTIQSLWSRLVPHRSVVERSGVRSPPQVLDPLVHLTQKYRRHALADLLEGLNSHFGIEWNEIAKVAGISRQAVTKWRNGQASPDNRRFGTLCKLTAFAYLIQRRGGDPPRWLKMRLQVADESESHLSISDVLSTGNFRLALQHFDRDISDREALEGGLSSLQHRSSRPSSHRTKRRRVRDLFRRTRSLFSRRGCRRSPRRLAVPSA